MPEDNRKTEFEAIESISSESKMLKRAHLVKNRPLRIASSQHDMNERKTYRLQAFKSGTDFCFNMKYPILNKQIDYGQ